MPGSDLEIRENVPLAPLTTLGVGGPARFFVRISNANQIDQAVSFARSRELPLFVLGGGSNLVVSDRGFSGLVIQIALDNIREKAEHNRLVCDVGAGCDWDTFVAFCVQRNARGIECLSGIPGRVGGTPVQNVGAYGQEVSDTMASLLAYDLAENRARELTNAECGFAYRTSVFNSGQRDRFIILQVRYQLEVGAAPTLRYADLQKHFADLQRSPTLADVRDAVLMIRASKGMLISPGDPDSCSAGSFFKNPVLSGAQYAHLQEKATQRGLHVPSYPGLVQQHKVSAAWLVENSGFQKGYTRGPAGISSKHALAIVNRGGAAAADVIDLRDEIQAKVEQTWGITLQPEPVFLGFEVV